MTAIKPAVLKQESARLTELFINSDSFVRELHRLLDRYSDRTHRMGQAGESNSILPAYNAPPPVLRQIYRDLIGPAHNNPGETLILCDKLWTEAHYELRCLAAYLLGQVPLDPPENVTRRITKWVDQVNDERIIDVLLDYGLMRMRGEALEQLYKIAETWLESPNQHYLRMGIRILVPLVEHPTSEDIPLILRLTTPLIREATIDVRPDVLLLWKRLALTGPEETAYYLLQNLRAPNNPDTRWFIRHLINNFPKEIQDKLRMALKETSSR